MTAASNRESAGPPRPQRAPDSRGRDERAAQAHLDALLDDALADTFPASDAVALLAPAA
jgi:hypothetical protein